MEADIKREIARIKPKTINILTPMLEAITNSIEANATRINLTIEVTDADTDIESYTSTAPLYKKRLSGYSIEDNGEGFNPNNIKSFFTLRSDHKKQLGCLGYGRMTWLVVFENIEIESFVNNKKVSFIFNLSSADNSKDFLEEEAISQPNSTIIRFDNLQNYYKNNSIFENTNNNEDIVKYIKESIQEHFLLKLSLMKKYDKDCTIFITLHNYSDKISIKMLPDLSEKSFFIKDADMKDIRFTLFYQKFDTQGKWEIYYCAHGRSVCNISKLDLKETKDYKFIAMLLSNYLDENINDSRTGFDFPTKEESDLAGIIDESTVINNLRPVLDEILMELYPTLQEQNLATMEEAIEEAPYLASYIRKDGSIIKIKKNLIAEAEKVFKKHKEDIRKKFNKILESKKIDESLENIITELSDIQARELGEYILFRESLIRCLQTLVDRKEKQESLLHNIFMKIRTGSDNLNHSVYDNNIWLLDDKFMSYVYAASDQEIYKIYQAIEAKNAEDKNYKRPDIAMFYSNADSEKRDAVIIEFKGINTTLGEKRKSLSEISDNIAHIRKLIPNINQIWGYVITDIDSEFKESLENQNYTKLFANNNGLVYHLMNSSPTVQANIYFYSVSALLNDAQVRNKVFLDILKQAD